MHQSSELQQIGLSLRENGNLPLGSVPTSTNAEINRVECGYSPARGALVVETKAPLRLSFGGVVERFSPSPRFVELFVSKTFTDPPRPISLHDSCHFRDQLVN